MSSNGELEMSDKHILTRRRGRKVSSQFVKCRVGIVDWSHLF